MTTTLESHINVSHVERPGMPSNPIVGILLNDLASAIIMRTTHAASVLAAHIQILGEQGIEEKLPNVPSLSVQATQTAFATGR